jgi:hypothetical protein
MATEYESRRAAYVGARDDADEARKRWAAFLPTAPLDAGDWKPPQTDTIRLAFDALCQAEAKEQQARDALFELLRPGGSQS